MEESKRLHTLEVLHKLRNGAIEEKGKLVNIMAELDHEPFTVGLCNMKLSHYDAEIQYFEDEIAKYAI